MEDKGWAIAFGTVATHEPSPKPVSAVPVGVNYRKRRMK